MTRRDVNEHSRNGSATARRWATVAVVAAGIAVVAAWPVAAATVVVGILVGERRLVRQRWWLGWSVAAMAAAMIVAGGPADWAATALRGAVSLTAAMSGALATFWVAVGLPDSWLSGPGRWGAARTLWAQLLAGVPVGVAAAAVYNLFRLDSRKQMGRIDGAEYSNVRPVGVLDRRRARRTLAAVADGKHTRPVGDSGGVSALGAGKYGAPVLIERSTLKKPTLIHGGPRTGKTRLATSIATQEVHAGAGLIAIDYKGDPAFVTHYANVAADTGRSFLHFQLFGKSLGAYTRPHPYAPATPASYDPLSRGNGASKAEMLLNSAPRDGDAAAYLRAALEVVQLAYDVANLTGFDRGRGGFEVIEQMLDLEFLAAQAEAVTPAMVATQFPSMTARQATERATRIQSRVAQQVGEARKNPIFKGAINDSKTWVSYFASSPAIGGMMRPGQLDTTIDLVRAVLRSEIVVFSLPVQDYAEQAAAIGNMILLDLSAAVSTLRSHKSAVAQITGVDASAADATPWPPTVVQIEEFGSANNEVILGVLNKSSAEGLRVILSTQAWADLQAVDGTGVWARRVLEQVGNVFSFAGVEPEGDKLISDTSGKVRKLRPRESIQVRKANIIGVGRSARRADDTMTTTEEEPRIDYGTVQALLPPPAFEFLWIAKTPRLTAVHTVPEGPNQWFEPLRFSGVYELPLGWSASTALDASDVAQLQQRGDSNRRAMVQQVTADPTLANMMIRGLDDANAQNLHRQLTAELHTPGNDWIDVPLPLQLEPAADTDAGPPVPPRLSAPKLSAPGGPPPVPAAGLRRRRASPLEAPNPPAPKPAPRAAPESRPADSPPADSPPAKPNSLGIDPNQPIIWD